MGSPHLIDSEDWLDRGAAKRVISGPDGPTVIRRTVKDFQFGKDLGEGSYSTVVLATDKITSKQYAVKVLDKRHIIKEKKVKYVNIEKHALNRLSQCDGIISLFFTFQDKFSLYFVLDYAANGELLGFIKKYGTLNEDTTRYFGAQILEGIKNMHQNGIIHRDIKPENILLDDKFRIRITDFGTAKLLEKKKNDKTGEEDYPADVRAKSFVGTAEYVSPELLDNKYCGKPGDVWAFGCIIYQMIAGKPPFKATNEYLTFQKITKVQYAFSAGFPLILRDLIKQILVLRPSRRATIDVIQKHPFFSQYNFSDPTLIWASPVPEFGPYKMTAQSMMKMPPKVSGPAKKSESVKNSDLGRSNVKPREQKTENDQDAKSEPAKRPVRRISSTPAAAHLSAAKVAAFVLSKDEDEDEKESPTASLHASKQTQQSSGARGHPAPEYIPGTNILRPQINAMNISRNSIPTYTRADSDLKKKKRTVDVSPPTALDIAWQSYLDENERVIHVGHAVVTKQTSEAFGKRYKGLAHEAHLSYGNKMHQFTRSTSKSMLSQFVQDNRLRDANESATSTIKDENEAFDFNAEEPPRSLVSEEQNDSKGESSGGHKIGKSLFKKFLANGEKRTSTLGEEKPTIPVSFEKATTCTVLITQYGRVQLFIREDQSTVLKKVCEIKLNFPFIQIKEIVSTSNSKFSRLSSTHGSFAIVSTSIAFVFEVEKYEVGQWTEFLARSKLNEFEREKESAEVRTPTTSPRISVDSPKFAKSNSPSQVSGPRKKVEVLPKPRIVHPTLDPKVNGYSHHLAQKTIRGKEMIRKKPPPPPPSQLIETNGLMKIGQNQESGTIHAAQLAVSQSTITPSSPVATVRRSSFTREGSLHRIPSTGHLGKVTSMNSKLLARSRGNK